MVTAIRTATEDFIPVDGDGEGNRWHATLHLCDPWTKVEIELIWHESFPGREEAEERLAEEMEGLPGWAKGGIAMAPVCRICRAN